MSILGFVDVDSKIPEFDRAKFWREISGEDKCDHPHTNSIQLPTLRFIHKWMGLKLFPRDGIRIITEEDLKLMLAMIKREKISPIQFMMVHWAKVFNRVGAIEYTSLVTRLAENLGLLDTALVANIRRGRIYINEDHMRQGHLLRGNRNTGIFMTYSGHTTEVPLPNPDLALYSTNSLLVLPSKTAAVGRSESARNNRNFPTCYYGTDVDPQGPSHTGYQTFEQVGTSRAFQATHNPWEQATPQHSGGSW